MLCVILVSLLYCLKQLAQFEGENQCCFTLHPCACKCVWLFRLINLLSTCCHLFDLAMLLISLLISYRLFQYDVLFLLFSFSIHGLWSCARDKPYILSEMQGTSQIHTHTPTHSTVNQPSPSSLLPPPLPRGKGPAD